MSYYTQLLYNNILWVSLLAWFIAQFLKVILLLFLIRSSILEDSLGLAGCQALILPL